MCAYYPVCGDITDNVVEVCCMVSGDASSAGSCDEDDTPSGSKQSAAALCIGVGSFLDPEDVQGLAHFLEHSKYCNSIGYTYYPHVN